MDKDDLQPLLDVICDKMARLSSIEQDTYLQEEVDTIMGTVYNRTRKINLCLRESRTPKISAASSMEGKCPNVRENTQNTSAITSTVETQVESPHDTVYVTDAQHVSHTPVMPSATSNHPHTQSIGVNSSVSIASSSIQAGISNASVVIDTTLPQNSWPPVPIMNNTHQGSMVCYILIHVLCLRTYGEIHQTTQDLLQPSPCSQVDH